MCPVWVKLIVYCSIISLFVEWRGFAPYPDGSGLKMRKIVALNLMVWAFSDVDVDRRA